ncbi:MAG: iron-sulfur cluster repair di-iron protein [Pyrinomonadaceae bacterium]|nr:iron-sulfur cluster repair di-iron protein [Pyrinomonadaceae bacterium]
MQEFGNKTVREIALELPQTTRVFEEFKIDYCCGGRKPLAEACANAGVDISAVVEKLTRTMSDRQADPSITPSDSLTKLMDHIIDTHHVYTRKELSALFPLMEKVVRAHGGNHPELLELQESFIELANDLMPHLEKEELVLFPYIRRMEQNVRNGLGVPAAPFGTVMNPVRMMMMEHDTAGDILKKMRLLSGDYTTPPDACPSFTGLFHRLQELERDLHQHIHLENNVLFPEALEIEERELTQSASPM